MAYQAPSTHVTGYVVTSTDWAIQVNNDKFFHGPPTVRATRTATQSIGNNAWTPISFDTKDWDTNNMFATTGTKLTCQTAGKYMVTINGCFANSSLGSLRGAAVQKNTTTVGNAHELETLVATTALTAVCPRWSGATTVALTTGQFLRMLVIQDSGGSLNTSTAGGNQNVPACRMSMVWVSS